MKKSLVFLTHFAYWSSCSIFLLMLFIATRSGTEFAPAADHVLKAITGFVAIPALLSFYTAYLVLFPRFLRPRKIVSLIGFMLITALGSALAGSAILSLLLGPTILLNDGLTSLFQELLIMGLIGIANCAVAMVLKGAITWYDELKLREELIQKTHDTELALVKAQLDPHFLFNTINNIDVLIMKDAQKASDYLNKLSDILRFMLFSTKTERIPLSQEVEYIQKFIELQRIRSENPDYVHFDCADSTEKWEIEPMLLIPFVENAFKHASGKKLDNSIQINLRLTDDQMIFTCRNRFSPSKNVDSNGLGNELMARRLELLYPSRHALETSIEQDSYLVKLTLKKHG